MAKSIFERLGGTYERQGDDLIPRLTLPTEKEKSVGIYGQRHLKYLNEYHRVTHTNLLTSGRLNDYLADIDKQVWGNAWKRSHSR